MDALGVQLLDGPETFGEVTRQAVDRRDHDDVAGIELFPGRRMVRPEATSVKMRSSRSPWSVRMRRWVARPPAPSAWETRM